MTKCVMTWCLRTSTGIMAVVACTVLLVYVHKRTSYGD